MLKLLIIAGFFISTIYASCVDPASLCGVNEEFSSCTQALCRAQRCSQVGRPIACPGVAEGSCQEGCICQENYVRGTDGLCIPEEQCNECGVNEEFSSCTQAVCRAQQCSQVGRPIACPGVAEGSCQEGCICQENYVRGPNGSCIAQEQCNVSECGANEEFSNCTQAVCRVQKCSQVGRPIACPGVAEGSCQEGCVCQENYIRGPDGPCIPQEQCTVCGVNEEFSSCTQAVCRAQQCSQVGRPIACPGVVEGSCKEGCICQENYVRGPDGSCISQEQCNVLECGANEEFSNCTEAVCRAQECREVGRPIACPGVAEGSCQEGCVCQENYVRGSDRSCIPQEQCNVCDVNEEFSTCTQAVCRAQQCSQVGRPIACPGLVEGSCQEGCVCQKNYVRGTNGSCIPQEQCNDTYI